MTQSTDQDVEKRRDEVLRRMLKAAPKPHAPKGAAKPQRSPAMRVKKSALSQK